MSVVLGASLTLGSLRYDRHALAVAVSLTALPGVGRCRVVLPGALDVSAATGDEASLDLEGVALAVEAGLGAVVGVLGGPAPAVSSGRVVTGHVSMLRRSSTATTVEVADAGATLARCRPAVTYASGTAADVVKGLVADAEARVARVDLDLPLATYVADQSRTAGEHIGLLTRLAGGVATVGADGAVSAVALPTEPDVVLQHGRELLTWEIARSAPPAASIVAIGAGPAGAAGAPDALRPTTDALPSGAPAAGRTAVWEAAPVLRTPSAVRTATAALQTRQAAASARVSGRCLLLPQLRPGNVVTVRDLPGPDAGRLWLLTRVEHTLVPDGGGVTTFDGVAAPAADALGGLVTAAAGLL